MAYEPSLLCHMNRFVGGGGGLQFVDGFETGCNTCMTYPPFFDNYVINSEKLL